MARIYKGTESDFQLYLKREDITNVERITFFTSADGQSVDITEGIVVEGDNIKVDVNSNLFQDLNDGVLSYVVYGGDIVIERQSSYFLKTPISNPTTSIQLRKEETFSESGQFTITPDNGYKGLSEVIVNVDTDEYYNRGYQEGDTAGFERGYQEGNTDGYNNGYNEGQNNGFSSGRQFQLDLLENITITENGTYTKEDGYKEILVDVPSRGDYGQLTITENGYYDNQVLVRGGEPLGYLFRLNGGGYIFEVPDHNTIKMEIVYAHYNEAGEYFNGVKRGIIGNERFYIAEDAENPYLIYAKIGDWESKRYKIGDDFYLLSLSENEFRVNGQLIDRMPEGFIHNGARTNIFLNGISSMFGTPDEYYFYPNVAFYHEFKLWIDGELHLDVKPFYQEFEDGSYDYYYSGLNDNMAYRQFWRVSNNWISIMQTGQAGFKNVDAFDAIQVDVQPNLQHKLEWVSHKDDINGEEIEIHPDDGYDGLTFATVNVGGLMHTLTEEVKSEIINEAQEVEITTNGVYYTKYSHNNNSAPSNYAILNGQVYDTGIIPTWDTTVEIWYNNENANLDAEEGFIIGCQNIENVSQIFKIFWQKAFGSWKAEVAGNDIPFNFEYEGWHHLSISPNGGFYLNGNFYGSFPYIENWTCGNTIKINGGFEERPDYCANGKFGPINIDGNLFTPSPDGFRNMYGDLLPLISEGTGPYEYVENTENNNTEFPFLIKKITVNVPQEGGEGGNANIGSLFTSSDALTSNDVKMCGYVNDLTPDMDGWHYIDIDYTPLKREIKDKTISNVRSNLQTINITENGTYTPTPTEYLKVRHGNDFNLCTVKRNAIIEIKLRIDAEQDNFNGRIIGGYIGDRWMGLKTEGSNIKVEWGKYSGNYTIDWSELNTIVIMPYRGGCTITINDNRYSTSEDLEDIAEDVDINIVLGNIDEGANFDFFSAIIFTGSEICTYKPADNAILVNDETISNNSDGYCYLESEQMSLGFERVYVNVPSDTQPNIEDTRWAEPHIDEVDSNGYLVYHKSEGYDGMDRVAINMYYYDQEKYNEGYVMGAADNGPKYPYLHIPTDTIYYKTADGQVCENLGLNYNGGSSGFGKGIDGRYLSIVSNTYEDGVGKIVFDGVVYKVGAVMYSNATETGDGLLELENIVEIQLPSSVISVDVGAFSQTGLREIILPQNISQIDANALNDMQYLHRIVFYSGEPEIVSNNQITLEQTTFGKILYNKAYDYTNMENNSYYKQKGWTFETF